MGNKTVYDRCEDYRVTSVLIARMEKLQETYTSKHEGGLRLVLATAMLRDFRDKQFNDIEEMLAIVKSAGPGPLL